MTTGDYTRMLRRTGVTAREAVAIAGLTGTSTLLEIYNSKVNDVALQPEPVTDIEMLKAYYKKAAGLRPEPHALLRHRSKKFALAEIGWAAVGMNTTVRTRGGQGLDAAGVQLSEKLVRFRSAVKSKAWGAPGGQMVPEDIYNECQWDMAVAEKEETDVVVRFVGGGFAIYTIRFVEEIFNGYYAIAEHFMSVYALPNNPPPTVEEVLADMRARRKKPEDEKPTEDKP